MMKKIFALSFVFIILFSAACVSGDQKGLKEMVNKEVALSGVARDAKGGAVVVTKNGGVVYIDGLTGWDDKFSGRNIEVKGVLRLKNYIPDPYVDEKGGISQGAEGDEFVLEKAKWKLR